MNRRERRALPRALREQRASIRTKEDGLAYLDALAAHQDDQRAARGRKTAEFLARASGKQCRDEEPSS